MSRRIAAGWEIIMKKRLLPMILIISMLPVLGIHANDNKRIKAELYSDNTVVFFYNGKAEEQNEAFMSAAVFDNNGAALGIGQLNRLDENIRLVLKVPKSNRIENLVFKIRMNGKIYGNNDIDFDKKELPVYDNVVYAAPYGCDEYSGSMFTPVKTIERAKEIARENGIDMIVFREGKYELKDTVKFNKEDSGTSDVPIRYMAYPGENPVFYGGVYIAGAEFGDASAQELELLGISDSLRGKIVKYDLKQKGITKDMLDYALPQWSEGDMSAYGNVDNRMMVTVDDVFYHTARYPNKIENKDYPENPYDKYLSIGNIIENGQNGKNAEFISSCERISGWKNTDNALITGAMGYHYAPTSCRVDIDKTNNHVKLKKYGGAYTVLSNGGRYFFDNIPDELDEDGEYYITKDCELYMFKPENFGSRCVKVSTFDKEYMFDFTDASNITLDGLTIEMTKRNAIRAVGGENILIKNCSIKNIGNAGVTFGHNYFDNSFFQYFDISDENEVQRLLKMYDIMKSGRNHTVDNCRIINTGKQACKFAGGSMLTLEESGFTVKNSELKYSGMFSSGYNSGISLSGCGFEIKNNDIYFARGQAVTGLVNMSNIVYNDFGNCCCDMLEDTGVIYINYVASNLDTKIRYNYIHDVPDFDVRLGKGHGYALRGSVYHDNCDFYEENNFNVIANVPTGAASVREGDNYVTNNLYIDCDSAMNDTTDSFSELKGKDFDWVSKRYGNFPNLYYSDKMPIYSDNGVFNKWHEKYAHFKDMLDWYKNKSDYTQTMQKLYDNVVVNIRKSRIGKKFDNSIKTDKYGLIDNNLYFTEDIGFEDYKSKNYQLTKPTAEKLGIEWTDLRKIGADGTGIKESINLLPITPAVTNSSLTLSFEEGVGIKNVFVNGRQIYEGKYILNYRKIQNVPEQYNRIMLDKSLFAQSGEYEIKAESYFGTTETVSVNVSSGESGLNYENAAKIALEKGKYYSDAYLDIDKAAADKNSVELEDIINECGEVIYENHSSIILSDSVYNAVSNQHYLTLEALIEAIQKIYDENKCELSVLSADTSTYTDKVFDIPDNASVTKVFVDGKKAEYTQDSNRLTVLKDAFNKIGKYKICVYTTGKEWFCGTVTVDELNVLFTENSVNEWEKEYVRGTSKPKIPVGNTVDTTLVTQYTENKINLRTIDTFGELAGSNAVNANLAVTKELSDEYIRDDVTEVRFTVKNSGNGFSKIQIMLGDRNLMSICSSTLSSAWPYYYVDRNLDLNSYLEEIDFKIQYNMIDKQERIWYKSHSSDKWQEVKKYNRVSDDEDKAATGYSTEYMTLANAPIFKTISIVKNAIGNSTVSDISVKSQINDMIKRIEALDLDNREEIESLMSDYGDMTKYFSDECKSKITNYSRLESLYNAPSVQNISFNGKTLTADVDTQEKECVFIAAVYNNGRLVESTAVDGAEISDNKLKAELKSYVDGDSVKLFIMNNLDALKPYGEVRKVRY